MTRMDKKLMILVILTGCKFLIGLSQGTRNCDVNFEGRLQTGVLVSPNFPFDYKNNLICHYSIYFDSNEPSFGREVCFTFYRFRLQYSDGCRDDYVDFESESGERMKYCGTGDLAENIDMTNMDRASVFNEHFCWPAPGKVVMIRLFTDARQNDTGFYSTFEVKYCDDERKETPQTLKQYSIAPCTDYQFTCFNRQCIPDSRRCNGDDDCGDGSDEDYRHARCHDMQDISGCDLELDDDTNYHPCGFKTDNWRMDIFSLNGPRYDHTIGDLASGYFLYSNFLSMEPANLSYTAVPVYSDTDQCLSLWYFMSGYAGTLSVNITSNHANSSHVVWTREGNQGAQWISALIDVPKEAFPLKEIVIHTTPFYNDDELFYVNMAVDDISLMPGACRGDDLSCQFELGFCGWQNDPNLLPWQRNRGPTPTRDTGPDSDMSGTGFYAYLNAASGTAGTKIRLVSRSISRRSPYGAQCLRFWYHMYGQSVDDLKVLVINYEEYDFEIWGRYGNHGNQWNEGQATILTKDFEGPFQIMFEATVGETRFSDIALDDIILLEGYCSHQSTTTVNGTTLPATCSPEQAFRCDSGHCIPEVWVCDGRYDCPDDHSDEEGCPGSRIHLSTGVVIGITVGAAFVAISSAVLTVVFVRRQKNRSNHNNDNGQDSGGGSLYSNLYSTIYETAGPVVVADESTELDPPPPYAISLDPLTPEQHGLQVSAGLPPPYTSTTGAQPAITIAIYPEEQGSPPSYGIAIYSRPRSSSYHEAQYSEDVIENQESSNQQRHYVNVPQGIPTHLAIDNQKSAKKSRNQLAAVHGPANQNLSRQISQSQLRHAMRRIPNNYNNTGSNCRETTV